MAFLYETINNEVTITGYEGTVRHLQIPDCIDHFPVRAVAKSAFSRRKDLLYVRLPGTLRSLGLFAFYACTGLKRLSLYDSIADYYDGAFRQCTALEEIEIELYNERYSILRDLLAESDRTMRFFLHLPDGDARLLFPDYVLDFTEDTFARAFHSSIVGTGFTYRECVNKNGISFREYDRMFDRLAAVNVKLAAETALERLSYPYSLSEQARESYAAYIRENDGAAVKLAVDHDRTDWLEELLKDRLLSNEAASEAAEYASAAGKTMMVSMLLGVTAGERTSRRLSL